MLLGRIKKMPLSFRRVISIFPWLRVNLGKGGFSVSLGRNGLGFTLNKGGIDSTVGIPKTGLFYRKRVFSFKEPLGTDAQGSRKVGVVSEENVAGGRIDDTKISVDRSNSRRTKELDEDNVSAKRIQQIVARIDERLKGKDRGQ